MKSFAESVIDVFPLHKRLVKLLVEETDAPSRGGVLHLNRLLTDEQTERLASMPPAIPNQEAMVTAHLAYSKAYMSLARSRAAHLGMEWPERFETVTWVRLDDALSVKRPYSQHLHLLI